MHEFFGEPIHFYTRAAEALEDGTLVDVSETAKEAGFRRTRGTHSRSLCRLQGSLLTESFGSRGRGRQGMGLALHGGHGREKAVQPRLFGVRLFPDHAGRRRGYQQLPGQVRHLFR